MTNPSQEAASEYVASANISGPLALNKSEFRDAVKLRYGWDVPDMPSVCVCGEHFNVDHAMICKRGGFVIQRHNELRDLQAEMLRMVCNGVETEPILQDTTGEELNRGMRDWIL